MKFKKGQKVLYKKHKTSSNLGLENTDPKHFEVGKIYEIKRIACSNDKTYTLVGTKTYVFESQLETICQ